jgi:uncharacterized RDD family membrane protein YckC
MFGNIEPTLKKGDKEVKLKTIGPGIRLTHFLADLCIIFLLAYAISYIPVLGSLGIFQLGLFPLYYFFFEYRFQQTPGKYLSNTLVIDQYGGKPNPESIIIRSLIRLLPFEPFTCVLGDNMGWHDKLSKTYVVDRKELERAKIELMDEAEKLNRQLIIEPEKSKTKKRILILFLVSFFVWISISIIRTVHNFFREASELISTLPELVEEMDQSSEEINTDLLLGKWNSADNGNYIYLEFLENGDLISLNQEGLSDTLRYEAEAGGLIFRNEKKTTDSFLIYKLNDEQLLLHNIQKVDDNILFTKTE